MDIEKRRAIARKPEKRSFSQDHGLAAQAGRKGGHASHGMLHAAAKAPA